MITNKNIFLNTKSSVIRMITDMIEEIKNDSSFDLGGLDLEFINIDAHANLAAFEQKHYIGLRSFSMSLDDKFVQVGWEFAIATWEDKDMRLHDQIINHLIPKCYVTESFNLLDEKAQKYGIGTFIGNTEIPPVHKATTRAIQYILVEAVLDETI